MANGISRARLAIPRVQQNPRPPRVGNAHPLATRLASNGGTTAPAKTVQSPTAGRGLQTPKGFGQEFGAYQTAQKNAAAGQPSDALKQAAAGISSANFTPGSISAASTTPTPAPSSNALFQIPTWTPANAGEPDPRDSSYWANLAKLKFTDEQEYQKTLGEETSSNNAYNLALQQAIRGRGVQERELGENAIKGNLSASGWLNRNQAEQSTTYAEERGAASRGHEGELQAFQAARTALQQGFSLEAAQELAEAAGRRAEAVAKETESGAPEASPVSAGSSSGKPKREQGPVSAKGWVKILREREGKKKGK